MTLSIKNQVYLDVKCNGTPLPIAENSFSKFEQIENVQNKLPTLEFVYADAMNVLHDSGCVSGSTIEVTFHSNKTGDPGPPVTVTYIVTGTNTKLNGFSMVWYVSAIFNAMKYVSGLVKGSFPGNSHEVVNQLGQQCNLNTIVDSFSDKMNWIPSRETFSDFIANVVDHGYAGGDSIASHAVNDRGELHYKNLQTLASSPASKTIISGTPDLIKGNTIPCISFEMFSMSGMYNMLYNYGLKVVQEQLSGQADIFNQYDATQFSEFLSLSSAIKSAIDGDVRSEYFPPDHGNCHQNYSKAEYQNRRGRQLFNERTEFNVANSTGINLYDVLNFNPTLPTNNKVSDLWKGNYITSAKTKYLQGQYYMEKLQALSQGFSSNAGGSLISAQTNTGQTTSKSSGSSEQFDI